MRRLIRDISSVLMISGLLLVIDAGVTLIWQEPVTAVVALVKRSEINKHFLTKPLSTLDRSALRSLSSMQQRIAFLARRERRDVSTGAAIGKIVISKIGASFDVVQGTDTAEPGEGARPLPEHRPPWPRPDRRDRRAPDDVPRALPPHRCADPRRPDRVEDALRPFYVCCPVPQDRRADGVVGDRQRRIRAARSLGVQSALQRSPANCRFCTASGGNPYRCCKGHLNGLGACAQSPPAHAPAAGRHMCRPEQSRC